MASTLTKRAQARNERTLQELIKSVPGNDRCADCGARNPGWASWSLGLFLCMRCAALHRKLGTHISKVKSLSMDSWSSEQVENMKRTGNAISNRKFNPQNVKPSMPIDVDEVDGAMERFIRQKYEHRVFSGSGAALGARQNTGSTSASSADDRPPPLPPKPGRRFNFGLRAASSTFPVRRGSGFDKSPPVSPNMSGIGNGPPSPQRVNKASRVFGSNVNSSGDGFDIKLAQLKDMGFPDEKRNLQVLKSLNGNLDRAVESLIRSGEGSSTAPTKSPSAEFPPASKNVTTNEAIAGTAGNPATESTSTNPFDALNTAQTQSFQTLYVNGLQTDGSVPPSNQTNPYNPFLAQPQSQSTLDQSFQGLQISHLQPTQQLFPNSTGGYGTQQFHQQTNPWAQQLQTFTPPPLPQAPPQYNGFTGLTSFTDPQCHFQAAQNVDHNPFLRNIRSQVFSPGNPFGQPTENTTSTYPFQQQHTLAVQPTGVPTTDQLQAQRQAPFLTTPTVFAQQQVTGHSQASLPQISFEFQQQQTPQNGMLEGTLFQQQQMQSQNNAQPLGRYDRSSILALYNMPHLAPRRPIDASSASSDGPEGQQVLKQRSVTMPLPQTASDAPAAPRNHNPFSMAKTLLNGVGPSINGSSHMSHDSVDFSGLNTGRHSPDAFAGLSSSYVR